MFCIHKFSSNLCSFAVSMLEVSVLTVLTPPFRILKLKIITITGYLYICNEFIVLGLLCIRCDYIILNPSLPFGQEQSSIMENETATKILEQHSNS